MLDSRNIKRAAMWSLLPALLLNVTVANQQWKVGPLLVSQFLFFWPSIACASVVVVSALGARSVWPPLLIGGLFVSRLMRLNDAAGPLYYLYGVPLFTLFTLAGAIIALERRELLFRQLRFYLLLSVPFMLLQVAGAGDWTLALNTETLAVPKEQIAEARTTHPTLFVPPSEAEFAIGQSRPAGFMHANNVLSLVIMFALALQFGRIRSSRVTRADALFCAAMVLAMAKIVVLGFLVMVFWLHVRRPGLVRARMQRVVALTVLLYGVYALLFPALFVHHFNEQHVSYSVFIRLNDFVASLDPGLPGVHWLSSLLRGTPNRLSEAAAGSLSGYGNISHALPLLIPLGLVAAFFLRLGFSRFGKVCSTGANVAFLVLLMALLFPAAVPIWPSPLYWFILGVGLMPLPWLLSARVRESVASVSGTIRNSDRSGMHEPHGSQTDTARSGGALSLPSELAGQ